MNVAIISPNQNAYSETFIQAHRNIKAKVLFYYGGAIPRFLDGYGYVGPSFSKQDRIKNYIKRKFGFPILSDKEEAFAKSLLKNKVDVVLAEYGTTGASLVSTCKHYQIPLVTIFHGFDATKHEVLNSFREKYTALFAYSKAIVAVSNPIRDSLISLGCDGEKIVVSPCAPNNKFFSITPTYKEPQSFVAIGRFVNKKAPYYTILAFKQVIEEYPEAKLYFAGEGELLEVCKNIINHFQLHKNIKLLGKVSQLGYAEILSRVAGFIQHSITADDGDTEGTPVAILEASAAGIPIISTYHAGIPDVIIHEKTGLLINEHDVTGMAKCIIRIIKNPEFAKQLGANGKLRLIDQFTMEKHLEIIERSLGVT